MGFVDGNIPGLVALQSGKSNGSFGQPELCIERYSMYSSVRPEDKTEELEHVEQAPQP